MKFYSRLSLITSFTLITGYAFIFAYTTYYPTDLPTVQSGSGLTATSWNNLVNYANKAVKQETEVLTVTGGRVGIGTTSPGEKLEVTGKVLITDGGNYTIPALKIGTTNIGLSYPTTNVLNFITASLSRMVIDASGNIGIGTISPLVPLHVGIGGTNMGNGYEKIVASDTNTAGIAIHIGAKSLYMYQDVAGNTKLDAYDYSTNTALPVQLGGNGGGYIYVSATGKVGIGMTAPTYQFQISTDSAGKPNGGSWANSSDQRIKKNVTSITNALEKIISLRGVQYEWKNPGEHAAQDGEVRAGFLAQEVAKVFPRFVNTIDASGKDKSLTPDGKIKNLSLPFDFDAYLVEAIKEQQKQISALQAEVQALKNR